MWPLVILVILTSLTGYFSMSDQVMHPIATHAGMEDLAVNMRVYRRALINYARSNPGVTGVIADSSLAFPSWYRKNPLWTNIVTASSVTVYATKRPPETITMDIVRMSGNSAFTGEADASDHTLVSPVFGKTSISIPAAVPHGVPVWISSIN